MATVLAMINRALLMMSLVSGLLVVSVPAPALAKECLEVFSKKEASIQVRVDDVFGRLYEGWRIPPPHSLEYQAVVSTFPEAMRREALTGGGHWDKTLTAKPRLPVPVAKLNSGVVAEMGRPRPHIPLPSLNENGDLFYPDHIKVGERGKPLMGENFFVRMMAVKNPGSEELVLPPQVEYLRPFFEEAMRLEKQRDPRNFIDRFAFIQVDASWVDANQNQPRPGKTTTQNPDPRNRQGAHVDGYLMKPFWNMNEDMTYCMSIGYDPKNPSASGDNIPTEYFDVPFRIPPGLTHSQARVMFDQIANQNLNRLVIGPPGVILRMGARVVHRVGVAHQRTYRTFMKIKFTDEAFTQAENTANIDAGGRLAPLYSQWQEWDLPRVRRTTLPTEGVIAAEDQVRFPDPNVAIAAKSSRPRGVQEGDSRATAP